MSRKRKQQQASIAVMEQMLMITLAQDDQIHTPLNPETEELWKKEWETRKQLSQQLLKPAESSVPELKL